MFTMVNTLNKKQIQYNQELKEIFLKKKKELKERETKNLDKEIQILHPQIRAQ